MRYERMKPSEQRTSHVSFYQSLTADWCKENNVPGASVVMMNRLCRYEYYKQPEHDDRGDHSIDNLATFVAHQCRRPDSGDERHYSEIHCEESCASIANLLEDS